MQNSFQDKGRSHKIAVLVIILVSYLMIVLDIAVAITALPKIHSSLGFSDTGLAWVQNAYTLAFGGLLLLGARSGDILGRRRMFILGVALFSVASFIVGVAPSAFWLIAGRALQGTGAAVLAPSTLALLSDYFPEGTERTRAVAYYGAVAGIGASTGLILGGVLTSWLSWRVAFFINVPIGIALILAAISFIVETQRTPGHFDIAGALSSTLGMTALVYGIIHSATTGFDYPLAIGIIVIGVLLLAFFVLNEWKAKQPIMPLRLFSSRERSGAYGARFLFLGAMMGFWFYITLFLQNVYGYTPLEAGLAFLPMTIANFIVAIAVPKLTERYGNGRLLAVGLIITMVGMAWLSRLSVEVPYLTAIALPMVVIGAGQGATLGPLTASGIAGVTKEDAGAASGAVNVAHQLGGSLGLSILVVVFAAAGSPGLDAQHILAERISASLTVGTVMLAFAFVLVMTLIVRSPSLCQNPEM
ncbi:MFS transporter [uncultured Methanospirillum sp.]|uniref:MFS transporter n=1 Tax=uncultured Methanospirillum sp. TaxID=262503 RepID=UPI0029C97D62|nr:MFS transporter [uncultured Methanospirillum sp.]